MNLLLDTHVFLWWILDAPELSPHARALIADPRARVRWSAASSWEIAIKFALGKLPLPESPATYVPRHVARHRFEPLPITDAHALEAGGLPLHHADPFDRLIVAQARVERLSLVSADAKLRAYDVDVLW